MGEDFRRLIKEVEAEAKAEGPAAEAELRELRREFSVEANQLTSAGSSIGDLSSDARCKRKGRQR
jgi:hypothetical protein